MTPEDFIYNDPMPFNRVGRNAIECDAKTNSAVQFTAIAHSAIKSIEYCTMKRIKHKGSGNRCLDSTFALIFDENLASRTSVIAIPNIVCFPNPPSQSQCLGNPATWVAVKSCSPLAFPESHTVFLVKLRIPGKPFQAQNTIRLNY